MIQRYLATVLKDAIAKVQADPLLLDALFKGLWNLEETEAAAIRTFFTRKPPSVVVGYPRGDSAFPLYAIVLSSERQSDKVLGDEGGMDDDPESESFGAEQIASVWKHSYSIYCCADHPDATTYLYELAKASLFVNETQYLARQCSLLNVEFSGTELAPDPRYMPEQMFVRQLVVECTREFNLLDQRSKLGKAFRVTGIAIDNSGSPSDVGGVKTNVRVLP